jgi:hypothetical protein
MGMDAMANDPPTTLRMGFGFRQARAAGLEGIRAPRSPRQVHRYIKDSKATREAIRGLRDAAKDLEWVPFITHRVSEGRSEQEIWDELYWIKCYVRMRARGYSVAYCLRHYWRS